MKKVVYTIRSLSHKRAFESLIPRDDMNQLVVGPHPGITSNIVPEDYSDFKIRNIKYYGTPKELQEILNRFSPDIYVEASLPVANGMKIPEHCKKVYVGHGMVGNHVKGIIKKAGFKTEVWKGCDLYCGATEVFADWVRHVAKVDDSKILLNAFPQLDILYDPNYYESYRNKVLVHTKHPKAKKVILYVGFCCKDRFDFNDHNEDYFRVVLELEEIARRHDWLVMVKPRQTFDVMMKFLKAHKWGKKYIKGYEYVQNSKHLHFITTTGHIYRYFFADAIVINGTSTVEVEACVIKKPLFIVRTCLTNRTNPYEMINQGAAMSVPVLEELEYDLVECFNNGSFHYPDKQEQRIKDMGILFDGKMYKRLQDKISIL